MKILIFKQPYPMGNYLLNEKVGRYLKNKGHNVYIIEQLNGRTLTQEYENQLLNLKPDIIYTEMLDWETFNIVEKIKCQKILLFASKGVLNKHEDIINYKNKWYTDILTNSIKIDKYLKSKNINSNFFTYYFSVLDEEDLTYKKEYDHDCTFLGMGYHRLQSPDYSKEKSLFFSNFNNNIDYKIYGAGWPNNRSYFNGKLPPDDIGKLYTSSKSGVAIIGKSQREHGQINNRYTEMAFSNIPIISINYENIDWFGAEKYINFATSRNEFYNIVKDIKTFMKDEYKNKCNNFKNFIKNKHNIFFELLEGIINGP